MVAGGYRWWYVDALSDDGRHCLTLIGFVGSVFSPYYARARRRGLAQPENHCAINAILYGPGSKHWAATERGAGDLSRDSDQLRVGPSQFRYDGEDLVADINEITVPWPRRLMGQVRLTPAARQARQFQLDPAGRHHWWPAAPVARVEVDFLHPKLRWSGHGYFDCNWGEEPLESGFRYWHWARQTEACGDVSVRYEAWPRQGERQLIGQRFDALGASVPIDVGESVKLPSTTVWRMSRPALGDAAMKVARTLEDTPFYSRSVLSSDGSARRDTVHESLDLDRFAARWVQCMLPFRMPRFPRAR